MAKGRGGFIGHDGLNAPDSPTGVTATAGDAQASISFTAPTDVGGSAITGYRAQSNDGSGGTVFGASGSSSPLTVTGLTNGTAYTFNVWAINAFGYSAPSDASGSVTPAVPAARGLIFGGGNTSALNIIEYIDINTTGNSVDFGDLTETKKGAGAYSSATRGVCHAGQKEASPYYLNIIDYVTIFSLGNATDFGDARSIKAYGAGLSNSTRGIYAGGVDNGSATAEIEYVTIASTGNALQFGQLVGVRNNFGDAGCASPTRGIFFGGYESGGSNAVNVIQYITIASTGNATDFGDMSAVQYGTMACSSATRGVRAGGLPGYVNTIEYVTIASTGNTTDFGDLTVGRYEGGATSSPTRGVFSGGESSGSVRSNVIDYITISSAGNATDFGDLTATRFLNPMTSSSHGGIS